jgi:hypothetical protein
MSLFLEDWREVWMMMVCFFYLTLWRSKLKFCGETEQLLDFTQPKWKVRNTWLLGDTTLSGSGGGGGAGGTLNVCLSWKTLLARALCTENLLAQEVPLIRLCVNKSKAWVLFSTHFLSHWKTDWKSGPLIARQGHVLFKIRRGSEWCSVTL